MLVTSIFSFSSNVPLKVSSTCSGLCSKGLGFFVVFQLQRERENHAMAQYRQPVIPSAGFYQPLPPPQPQGMYGQVRIPEQPQPYQVVSPQSPPYQYRVNDYNRNGGYILQATGFRIKALEILKSTFNPFPHKPWFLHVCRTSLLKTL